MPKSADDVKEVLLRENDEFKKLAEQHHELDERLSVLSDKIFLSEEEKLEEVKLKKKKLALKDKMASMIRRHQVDKNAEPPPAPSATL